jgi:peptidyl-prolyl cis-trans isomerase D
MFDLFRSREKGMRIMLGVMGGLLGLSMLTYLIPNYNSGGGSSNDFVVAEVGKQPITLREVQQLVQASMRGRQIPPEILPTYVPQLVDNLINERAQAYEAERLGFQVTDAQLADAIKQYVPNLFQDGRFVGKETYAAFLGQQNLTIQEFEDNVRRQLLISRLRDIALGSTVVTPLEIEQEYKKRNEKIKVEFVKLTSDKYKSEVEPSLAEMQQNYEINKANYTVPERRNLAILIADQGKIAMTVNIDDAALHRAYDQNQAAYRIGESVKVRHILLKTQGKPPAEEAKIKSQADDILKQVKAGANFGELVKKYSEDTASVPNGGEYTIQRNGQMVPEFENAAFTLKPGESSVIKTSYGYHIVQVMQHDPARVRPFEEVKTQLAADYKKQSVSNVMQKISDQAQSRLQKDPTHPEKVAAELGMQLVPANNVEPGSPVPEIGVNPDFDQSITALSKGQVSSPVALPGDKIALAVVTDVLPSRPATFDEVKTKVHDAMVQRRLEAAVQKHAKDLADQAKASGGDLAKAAKAAGLTTKTSDEVGRTGAIEGLGSAAYVLQGFQQPAGSVLSPIPVPDGVLVVKVVSHISPDMSKIAEQRNAVRDDIKNQKARDRGAVFESGLREALTKEGKIKVHQDVINRLIAQYKGNA